MNKLSVCVICILLITGFVSAFAASDQYILKESAKKPVADGKITDGEYSLTIALSNGTLSFSLVKGELSFGVYYKTSGWVAIGFGAQKMDKARMILASVVKDTATIKEQIGVGHKHTDVDKGMLVAQAAGQTEAGTTLEGEVPLKAVIGDNAKVLSLITAYSGSASLAAIHSFFKILQVTIQ
jgi:hypothetical protein